MGIIARMSRLSRFLERSIESVLSNHGINESQFAVLVARRRAGSPYCLSPTELYNSLLISSGAMTNRLDRLTRAGLIRRIPDFDDGRSSLVQLTAKGQKIIDEAAAAHYENEHSLLASLSPSENSMLAELLRKLLVQFEDHSPEKLPADSRQLPTKRGGSNKSAGRAGSAR